MIENSHIQSDRLIIFTRYPEPGAVKTRLVPVLGRAGAARLQQQLTEHLIGQLVGSLLPQIGITIQYTGASEHQMRQWLGSQLTFRPQQGHGLGERMEAALTEAGSQGNRRILLIGSDCPAIDADLIHTAHAALDSHDLVLGPSRDGGYYLIGGTGKTVTGDLHPLFTNIPWGTSSVWLRTRLRAEAAGLRCAELKILPDIDRPEDLVYFNYCPCSQ